MAVKQRKSAYLKLRIRLDDRAGRFYATCAREASREREDGSTTPARRAPRLPIVRTTNAASRPTPWIIVDEAECWKCWPTKYRPGSPSTRPLVCRGSPFSSKIG